MAYVADSAPHQVNLSSSARQRLLAAYKDNDTRAMGSADFFEEALKELFDDLKNSQAFMKFLDEGGSTAANLSVTGPSDISLS